MLLVPVKSVHAIGSPVFLEALVAGEGAVGLTILILSHPLIERGEKKVLQDALMVGAGVRREVYEDDVDGNAALDAATKGILKSKRKRLREVFTSDHSNRLSQIKLIDEILACTERVLNPAAHAGDPPLYQKEVQDALNMIKQLETTLNP